jgi:hypothetical protein
MLAGAESSRYRPWNFSCLLRVEIFFLTPDKAVFNATRYIQVSTFESPPEIGKTAPQGQQDVLDQVIGFSGIGVTQRYTPNAAAVLPYQCFKIRRHIPCNYPVYLIGRMPAVILTWL